MSWDNYRIAVKNMQDFEDFECSGGKTEDEIRKAEKELGIKFSSQCLDFYRNFDYSIFDGMEIFGIQSGAQSSVLEGNIVAYTLNDRKQYNLSIMWLPFFNFGDGTMAFYDYSSLNDYGEPVIIRAGYVMGKFVWIDQLSDDFGDFLYNLVIESQ